MWRLTINATAIRRALLHRFSDFALHRRSHRTSRHKKQVSQRQKASHPAQKDTQCPTAHCPHILLYYRDIGHIRGRNYYRSLFAIIHVSFYWRTLALSEPRLWLTINLRLPYAVTHCLRYSAARPLHLLLSAREWDPHTGYWYPTTRPLQSSVLNAINNPIDTLELIGTMFDVRRCLYFFCDPENHHLRMLKVSPIPVEDTHEYIKFEIDVLMQLSLPALQVLVLYKVVFDLGSDMFRTSAGSLRTVAATSPPASPTSRPPCPPSASSSS